MAESEQFKNFADGLDARLFTGLRVYEVMRSQLRLSSRASAARQGIVEHASVGWVEVSVDFDADPEVRVVEIERAVGRPDTESIEHSLKQDVAEADPVRCAARKALVDQHGKNTADFSATSSKGAMRSYEIL